MTGLDWTSLQDVVEYPVASAGDTFYLSGGASTVSLRGLRVTHGFVEGLGVAEAAGRRLSPGDFVPGSEPVALIGHSLWRDWFGADAAVAGRLIRLEPESRPGASETVQIVGVLAPGFFFGRDRTGVDLLVPQTSPVRVYMVRLREGVPQALAEHRLTEAARRAATSSLPAGWSGVQLESAHERWVGSVRPILRGVTVAASLVLIIVSANVAVLMLLRSMRRQREVAVRLALGSGWRHVARMLLAETSLICVAALGLGVALTALVLGALAPLVERQLGRQAPNDSGIAIDSAVLLIVGAVGVLVTVALSLAPLWSARRGLTNALQQDARVATEGRSMRRLRSGLIAFEIAGSVVLLVGCGLMIRSAVEMLGTDLGFNPHGLRASRIMLRARNYTHPAAYRQFHERFAARVQELTGASVVFSSWPPFVPPPSHLIEPDAGSASVTGGAIAVSAGYFSTFGIQMRQGREFTAHEASAEGPVAILSETLARRLWRDGNALGRRVRGIEQTQGGSTPGPWRTVIGIASDVRQEYDDRDQGDFYTPRTPDGRFGSFYIRSGRPAPFLYETFQGAAAEIDRDAVINRPREVAGDNHALAGTRFLTVLLTAFAAVTTLLAMLGIYGVTAYAVQQRQKEVAIRIALGASDHAVVRLFLREGILLLGVGTAAGLLGGALLFRVLRYELFGVGRFDAPTWLLACALLLSAGLIAVFWAARRASLANPVTALNTA